MNSHNNARLTPKGREDMVRAVVEHGLEQGRSRTPIQHHGQDGGQVGRALQGRGRCWLARPILKTSFIAKPNPARHSRCGREFAPSAPHPGAHRRRARHLQGQRLAHPQAPRLEPALSPRTARATPTLRARDAGRDHPYRHQEARPLQQHRPPHHRRPHRPEQCEAEAGPGWEFAHVAVDDHSRVAPSTSSRTRRRNSAVAFLKRHRRLLQEPRRHRRSRHDRQWLAAIKSFAFAHACKQLGIKHIRTKPYTPQTNGKAERFIQTALREWAYATAFETLRPAPQGTRALAPSLQLAQAAC